MIEFYDDENGCRPTVKLTDTGSMSTYQKLCYVLDKIEEIINFVNGIQTTIDNKEDSLNITNNRKLSPIGNFTGTLDGVEIYKVFQDILSNTDLSNHIIELINNNEALEGIYDGGWFTDTEPPTIFIDGGSF